MEPVHAFDVGLANFDRLVSLIRADQWRLPTPCSEWTVRGVLNHMTAEHLWAPFLLAGATIEEVGIRFEGDQLGAAPQATWHRVATKSRAAFHATLLDRQVHTIRGLIPAEEYLWQMTADLVLHAWDIAQGIDARPELDEPLAAAVYEHIKSDIDDWRLGGSFGPAVPAPPDSDMSTRLVALSGRHP